MKLVLANNQTDRFVTFYQDLQSKSSVPFDYEGYDTWLFSFESQARPAVSVINTKNQKALSDYDGLYINGYLDSYELAATMAIAADYLGIPYVNQEMNNPPSLSKLTMYAKLAAAGVSLPKTLAGAAKALKDADRQASGLRFPAILKRADADRGIDNFKVQTFEEALEILSGFDGRTIWILQEYIENKGFYLVSFYDQKPAFSIYRTLEARPDQNARKAHMYKPKGGANAGLIDLESLPKTVIEESERAVKVMNRQIASVDCIYDEHSGQSYILEVNYNPQLVTIETFKEVRIRAFLENLKNIK